MHTIDPAPITQQEDSAPSRKNLEAPKTKSKSARRIGRFKRGLTLVEVMIAAGVFSIISVGLTATFVQSLRFSKVISHRTQAINTATSIVEQLRERGFTDLLNDFYIPTTPPAFTVKVVDPGATATFPTYYSDLTIPINVRGTSTLSSAWTDALISVDSNPSAPKLPMKFWLTLKRDAGTGTSLHEVFQITLIYHWRSPGATSAAWKTGNMRIVAAKSTVGSAN
jgi:prepilin-type N-terminal cleavage/methylation domain-containing protein